MLNRRGRNVLPWELTNLFTTEPNCSNSKIWIAYQLQLVMCTGHNNKATSTNYWLIEDLIDLTGLQAIWSHHSTHTSRRLHKSTFWMKRAPTSPLSTEAKGMLWSYGSICKVCFPCGRIDTVAGSMWPKWVHCTYQQVPEFKPTLENTRMTHPAKHKIGTHLERGEG